MEKARWGAVCPETFILVLMIEGKCSRLRAKPAHLVGHLPVSPQNPFIFDPIYHFGEEILVLCRNICIRVCELLLRDKGSRKG
jgi:hypothetical protein